MTLDARIDERFHELVQQYLSDDVEFPEVSPCFVRAMLQDLRDNSILDGPSSRAVELALEGNRIADGLAVSVHPRVLWLCTRYQPLPRCNKWTFEEYNLHKKLLLLRGGVQLFASAGYRSLV